MGLGVAITWSRDRGNILIFPEIEASVPKTFLMTARRNFYWTQRDRAIYCETNFAACE